MTPLATASPAELVENSSRRQLILDAAERLLSVRGYDSIRLRDISRNAGISIGMIQHYFDSRDDLVRQMLVLACKRRAQEWTRLSRAGENDRVRLKALLSGAVSNSERCVVWVETCAAASRYQELRSVVASTNSLWRQTLTDVIRSGTEAGVFHPAASAKEIADIFVALIDGLMMAVATANSAFTVEYIDTLLLTAAQVHLVPDGGTFSRL